MKSTAVNRVMLLLGLMALTCLAPGPARAEHETIVIDGDLTDLIGAIGNNSGSALGGFAVPDVQNDVDTPKCPTFVNGFDVENFYLFLDFKNPDGTVDTNPTLYAGWDVFGVIGDTDGNGDPTTFNPGGPHGGCALSDQPGIGALESYRILLTFCGASFDQIVIKDVNNDGIADVQRFDGTDIPGAEVGISSNGLELRIPNFATLFPGVELCTMDFIMTANATEDGLGEDFSTELMLVDVPPSVTITKTPLIQTTCPDREVIWTLAVANDGFCDLETVTVRDTLDPGLTYVSSTPPRTSGDASVSVWTFTNVARGTALPAITLRARTAVACLGTVSNRVKVIGDNAPPAFCTVGQTRDSAAAIASVECAVPLCSITSPPGSSPPPTRVIIGERVELCGPAGLASYLWTRPNGTTAATQCLVVPAAAPSDSGTYTLRLTDAGGCISECSHLLDVDPPFAPVCRITGPDSLCVDEPLTLCGPEPPAGRQYVYFWRLPDLTEITTNSPDSCLTVPAPFTGVYTLVVRDVGSGLESEGCAHPFKVHKRPPCAISAPDVVTMGASVQICGPIGNFGYRWILPNSSIQTGRCVSIAAVAPADTGLYQLTVTDLATGCESDPTTCNYRLTVVPGPVCVITGPTELSAGESGELCGPAGDYTYLWMRPNGSTSTERCIQIPAAGAEDEGTYTLQVTSPGGTSATCFLQVRVIPPPECKNCPRTAEFWAGECEKQGGGKYSLVQLQQIAECVDDLSTYLNWDGFVPPSGSLVPKYSEWRYHDLGQDLGTDWKDPGYADGSWSSGPGVLGYGEGYVNTTVSFGPDEDEKFVTTYFRKSFDVTAAASLLGLKLRLMYDDGVVVYLNGVEVARRSMPAGAPLFGTLAHNHEASNTYELIDLNSFVGLIQDGTNVLAAEVHQADAGSSDLVFDLELIGEIDHGLPAVLTEWRYHDLGQDLGTTWKDPGYPDGSWSSGPGVLGYGEGYVSTTVSFGPDEEEKYVTTYFRKSFEVTAAAAIPGLRLRLMYDDGVIVYLNGVEVARRSLPSGAVTYQTLASSHEGDNSYDTIDLSAFAGLLHDGINVLAAEVHQTDRSSSDLVFDAGLEIPVPVALAAAAAGLESFAPGLPDVHGAPAVLDPFCAVLADYPKNDRREAERQFAALLANICASTITPQKGNPICLNLDTEVQCKYFDAQTLAELIVEVDLWLTALRSGPEDDEDYERIAECLTDINNGWAFPVSKDCRDDDDDDKKGRYTPVGTDVLVALGPTLTVTFGEVLAEGTTFVAHAPAMDVPAGLQAVEGVVIDISSTAATNGYVRVVISYDETLLRGPESQLRLMRFDVDTQQWIEIAASRNPITNQIEGMVDALATFVVVEPLSALAVEQPNRLESGLRAASPNPTTGRTTVSYALTRNGSAKVTVHDIQGRQVALLASGWHKAGEYSVVWNGRTEDGRSLPSGIYAIRLDSQEGLRTTKLVIVN